MSTKHKSNKAWIHEHINDAYVLAARSAGWRSRAAYKLMQIDEKDHLLGSGMLVVDLGAAPGSWSQYAAQRVAPGGRIYALDLLPMTNIAGVEFIQGDFREAEALARLEACLGNRQVDLVLSDMAPNLSGIADADQARIAHLAELTLDFARAHLKTGGDMLLKLFQGAGCMELRAAMQQSFEKILMRKPEASRGRSAETYLLARNKRASSSPTAIALESSNS